MIKIYVIKSGAMPITQDDCREFPNHDFDIQLLQITSDECISWGGSGVAHFFIRKEDPPLSKDASTIEQAV